jgi:hypothetical protein
MRTLTRTTIAATATLATALGSLLLVGAQPAAAAPAGTSIKVVKSQCLKRNGDGKPTFGWWGAGNQSPKKSVAEKSRVRGTMYVCVWKFRFSDSDRKFDYWGASVQSYWVRTGGEAAYAAKALHQIGSTRTARQGVFDGTDSYTSNKSCGTEWTLGVQLGIFAASAPVQACRSYKLEATRVSNAAGSWRMNKIGGFRKVETVYTQKVKQGQKPTFYVGTTIPRYTMKWQDIPGYWKSVPNFTSITVKL